jgi:hypothetical protein
MCWLLLVAGEVPFISVAVEVLAVMRCSQVILLQQVLIRLLLEREESEVKTLQV